MTKPTFETDTIKRYCASCAHCSNHRCEVFNRYVETDWNRCKNHSHYNPNAKAFKLDKNAERSLEADIKEREKHYKGWYQEALMLQRR